MAFVVCLTIVAFALASPAAAQKLELEPRASQSQSQSKPPQYRLDHGRLSLPSLELDPDLGDLEDEEPSFEHDLEDEDALTEEDWP